jgi:hypothetical protein
MRTPRPKEGEASISILTPLTLIFRTLLTPKFILTGYLEEGKMSLVSNRCPEGKFHIQLVMFVILTEWHHHNKKRRKSKGEHGSQHQ